jgi:hypothetical protein
LNYRKTRTPLTPQDNCKKIKVKKPKIPLYHGKKKLDLMGYVVITLYKNVQIQKCPLDIGCVIIFFRA